MPTKLKLCSSRGKAVHSFGAVRENALLPNEFWVDVFGWLKAGDHFYYHSTDFLKLRCFAQSFFFSEICSVLVKVFANQPPPPPPP